MKPIKNYENYLISKDGIIFNIKRNMYMKISVSNNGYNRVKLTNLSGMKTFSVHRLVALTYLPNTYNKPQINHINGNKLDNRIENLEWATREENMQHAFSNGLMKNFYDSAHKIVLDTQTGIYYESVKELSKITGINYSTIRSMLQGHRNNRTSYIYV